MTSEQMEINNWLHDVLNVIDMEDYDFNIVERIKLRLKERDEYALLLFQPCGESHHDANKCPYCKENLNGKT